jgi:hypothetical protein
MYTYTCVLYTVSGLFTWNWKFHLVTAPPPLLQPFYPDGIIRNVAGKADSTVDSQKTAWKRFFVLH